ncbi:MAG: hypothetical protein EAX96_05965 [Candidatus Lokiarchaeota archaeon]|nr:hypothetical protein [Candidatus Lokiarchaeota archaeon]
MVGYFKGEPSQFIVKYTSGKIKKIGRGISFFYLKYHTNIVVITAVTQDSHFIFNEITGNYQEITLQGHFTYQIKDPKKMASILDYSIDLVTKAYKTDDPEKLELRIKNIVQMHTKAEVLKLDLEDAIKISEELARNVLEKAKDEPLLKEMGVELLNLTFNSIRPTPEMSKALEAEYRENLQKKADQAIYARRAAAVEQERKIKENQLATEITLEEKKQNLIALQGENELKEAEFKSKATELELQPYLKLDSKQLLALALKDLARNANRIGNLTITSEILSQLLNQK